MTDHPSLFVLIIALAAGLVTSTVSALTFQARRIAFFRYFLGNILLFNLTVLAGLVFRYALSEPGGGDHRGGSTVLLAVMAVMTPLKLGWVWILVAMNRALAAGTRPVALGTRFLTVCAGVLLVWSLLSIAGGVYETPDPGEIANVGLELFVIGSALASSSRLLLDGTRSRSKSRRRSVTTFAGYHSVLFLVMLGSLLFGWLRPFGQSTNQTLFNGLLLIAYNLVPLAWFRWFPAPGPALLTDEVDRYGLTPREREIVELISTGRTNQEIADRLCISLATVKDHNHHIFRKAGVRNRVELVNRFRGSDEPAPPNI